MYYVSRLSNGTTYIDKDIESEPGYITIIAVVILCSEQDPHVIGTRWRKAEKCLFQSDSLDEAYAFAAIEVL